jgi:hypothetical protein
MAEESHVCDSGSRNLKTTRIKESFSSKNIKTSHCRKSGKYDDVPTLAFISWPITAL